MSGENRRSLKGELKNAFNIGYSNAAASLRKLVNEKVYFNHFHVGYYKLDSTNFIKHDFFGQNVAGRLLTTEIFGELAGKSYLFLSDDEYEILTRGIPESKNQEINFKDEFAKELDNILSAAVITALSNELDLQIYGDIPVMAGRPDNDIQKMIYSDFNSHAGEIYVTAMHFSFDNYPSISPYFVWVLDSKTLKALEPNSIV